MQVSQCGPVVRLRHCSHTLPFTHVLWPLHWQAVTEKKKISVFLWSQHHKLTAIYVSTLTRALDESPLKASLLGTEASVQNHVLGVLGLVLHGATVRALHTLSSACVTGVSTPATVRLLQTLTTRPETRAVLSWKQERKKERQREKDKVRKTMGAEQNVIHFWWDYSEITKSSNSG